jgi:serine/threonine protein kinase
MYWVKDRIVPTKEMMALADKSVRDLLIKQVTGEPRKTVAIAMELHSGTLTQHYIQHGRTITSVQKLRMCKNLLAALLYIWEHGFVHLDVKFDNVLVAEDGRLVLSDFGTAQHVDAQGWLLVSDDGQLLGNREHRAPELLVTPSALPVRIQMSGQPCWECGTMFYQMITGDFPYHSYPLGNAARHDRAVNGAALSAVNPVLCNVTLALIRWLPSERMSLVDATALLQQLPM